MSEEFIVMKVKGLAELTAQLDDLGAELAAKALAQAARRAFKPVLESAQQLVPVRSGELMRGIRLAVKKPSTGDTIVRVGLRISKGKGVGGMPPARRWHFVEFGTSHQAAHPFLRPALDRSAGRVLELLKVELAKSIEKALKKRAGAAK